MSRTQAASRWAGRLWMVAWVAMAAFCLHVTTGFGGPGSDALFGNWVYNGLILFSAGACAARCLLVRAERWAWAMIALALGCWAGGEIYHTVVLADMGITPFPSISDGFFVAFYPFCFAGLVLLVRRRVRPIGGALLLDGIVAALAVSSVAAAVTFGAALSGLVASAGIVAVVFNLAYPVGDLALLGSVAAALSLTGWRPGRALGSLALGVLIVALADSGYLLQSVHGVYEEGRWLDAMWPLGLMLTGWAAWRPVRPIALELSGRRVLTLPIVFSLAAVAVLTADHMLTVNQVALGLATSTVLAVVLRMAWSLRTNLHLLQATRTEALSDALTGLGNRRMLTIDLESTLEHALSDDAAERHLLLLFDLDGFKAYNDTYGHPEGDALLVRRSRALTSAISEHGRAYRLGGDEFCVLLTADEPGSQALIAACTAALSERGDGYEIRPSWGGVLLPDEAASPGLAIAVADERMYSRKKSRRASPRRQSTDVLLGVLRESDLNLDDHVTGVAELALRVCERLGMTPEEVDETARAAELHDIGKITIPEHILTKAGDLDQAEWNLMHRHTIVGERILRSAPALVPIARIVRASHERWDGAGYPDGLAGEQIPLGARVVAVCDAYDAMISDRPYRAALPADEALAELRRCSGTQFDPRVIEAFCTVVGERHREQKAAEERDLGFVADVREPTAWLGGRDAAPTRQATNAQPIAPPAR